MYPSYETIRIFARRKIKQKLGAHVKIRFTNRAGKLYCKVIDEKSGQFDNQTMNCVKEILHESGACSASLTSAGGGHYTYRFEMEDHRS